MRPPALLCEGGMSLLLRTLLAISAIAAGCRGQSEPRRRVQEEHELCPELAENGELVCEAGSAGARLCPATCSSAGAQQPTVCAQLAQRGELVCGEGSAGVEICPDACAASPAPAAPVSGGEAASFHWSCPVLLQLEGGCAHDLSQHDSLIDDGTRVSDVCPQECSGHVGCLPAVVDVALLGALEDTSGNDREVLVQSMWNDEDVVCVDGGGAHFGGAGGVRIAVDGGKYAREEQFSISLWVLKDVAVPHASQPTFEQLFFHGPRVEGVDNARIDIELSRGEWLDAWELHVWISGIGLRTFELA
eukprot:COSAG04_NODE_6697_length_1275_cov_1.053571_1_plen_303_part_10